MTELLDLENKDDLENKSVQLWNSICEYTKKDTVLAFSGGVDSSLLLYMMCKAAQNHKTTVYAVMVQSELSPVKDVEIARMVARQAGACFNVQNIDELSQPGIYDNRTDRCYVCKKYLFSSLIEFAARKGIQTILEGTNEDDLHVYRPGIRAIRELGIKSPLADAHLTKSQVRMLSKKYGISVADRPSAPCLATRFPYGTHLTKDGLKAVENGEAYMRELGFSNVRLRIYDGLVRIEVDRPQMGLLLEYSDRIVSHLKSLGYDYVTLDLEGFRSGSMDIHIKKGK